MAILILNTDDSELFLPSAYLELFNALQGVSAIVPNACVEHARVCAGTLHFQYFDDESGRLKSIYYRTCEEST